MFVGGQDFWIGIYMWVVGVVFVIFVGIVIVGGVFKIGVVIFKIVLFMGIFYVIMCLVVIGVNIFQVGSVFEVIWFGVFIGYGVVGGIFGVLIVGVQCVVFLNVVGIGIVGIVYFVVKMCCLV